MEPEGSHEPVTGPNHQSKQPSPHLHTTSSTSTLIISSYLCLGLPSILLPLSFSTNRVPTFHPPILVTCLTHLSLFNFVILIIFCMSKNYKSPIMKFFPSPNRSIALRSKYSFSSRPGLDRLTICARVRYHRANSRLLYIVMDTN
jgi:hypothetical protein